MRIRFAVVLGALIAGGTPGLVSAQSGVAPGSSPSTTNEFKPGGTPAASEEQAGIVTTFTIKLAEDVATQIGITNLSTTQNDDKTTTITGVSGEVPILIQLGDCATGCTYVSLYADFGIQSDATPDFINKFNLTHNEKMAIDSDKKLVLMTSLFADEGVTVKHIVYLGQSFIDNVKEALTWKPE